jgi:hypothetical protein
VGHILYHLTHLNHGRQDEVHIKDRCFHCVLLAISINSHSAKHYLPIRWP